MVDYSFERMFLLRQRKKFISWFAASLLFAAFSSVSANTYDQQVLHPSIPLLDEEGEHVLDSGKAYSAKTSCGTAGCHDYDSITHAYHFEMGRDEANDNYGAKRGLPQLVSPGYFGGYACMGGNNPRIVAKKHNASAEDFADIGTPGLVMACEGCHTGGGWMEKDRTGLRFDQKDAANVSPFDGDYFNRGTDEKNKSVDSDVVAQWDWKKSGVVEANCFVCHADFSSLKKTDPLLGKNDLSDESDSAYDNYNALRRYQLIDKGLFRYANTAVLEFLDLDVLAENGGSATPSLLTFSRQVAAYSGHGATPAFPSTELTLSDGLPQLNWNAEAFDSNGKVAIPMLRFPANDNCMVCHRTSNSRRGFYGFGEGADATYDEDGVLEEDYQDDVHKGKTWTADNGETRSIENCNACHSRNYFKKSFANTDLDANHNILKGNSDMDVRNDLDFEPAAKSCEYCHDTAESAAIPSGHDSMLSAHRELWKSNGDMAGYPLSKLSQITQTHLDVVSCQSCHITGKKYKGKPLTPLYRYREGEDGQQKIIPYNPRVRYYWKDKTSGYVLNMTERNSVFEARKDSYGESYGVIVDPESGKELASVSARMSHGSLRFGDPEDYAGFVALKSAYDKVLSQKGLQDANAIQVWTESNQYIMSHNVRSSPASVQCEECHSRKQDGAFSALISTDGLFGEGNIKEITTLADAKLLEEGLVELDMPYMKLVEGGVIQESVADILYVTKLDPSMTVLRNSTATSVIGELRQRDAGSAIKEAGIIDSALREKLGDYLAQQETFVFTSRYGAKPLRQVALLAQVDAQTEAVLPAYQFELSLAGSDVVDKVKAAGLGELEAPIISLNARNASREEVSNLPANFVVKLPISAGKMDADKLKVIVSSDGDHWQIVEESAVLHMQSADEENDGFVLMSTQHSSYYSVVEDVPPVPSVVVEETDPEQAVEDAPKKKKKSGGAAGTSLILFLSFVSLLKLFFRKQRVRGNTVSRIS